jgi:MFS family permease
MDLVATSRGRKLVFAALYLSEGAPIGFIWWYLPAKLRQAELGVDQITALTGVLVLPWTLKFVWAPLIDVLRTSRWSHRYWILSMQALMGLTLLPLAWLDLLDDWSWVYALLLMHAVAAATQDVAIDAWAIGRTPRAEHAGISGWMQAGKYCGRWLFGAGLLLLGGALGRGMVLPALVAVIWASGALVWLSHDVDDEPADGRGFDQTRRWRVFVDTLKSVLRRKTTWLGLGLAVLAGAAFEAVGGVATVYLIDLQFTQAQVGAFLTGSVAMLLGGSLLGGWLADKVGHVRAVAAFLLLTAGAVVAVAVSGLVFAGDLAAWAAFTTLLGVYLAAGMLIASTYGLFMDMTDPRIAGTQFSAFMGATNACESWSNITVGRLIAPASVGLGYGPAFLIMAALSLLALPLLPWIRRAQRDRESLAPRTEKHSGK